MGIDRRLLYNIDWVLIGALAALTSCGVAMVWSAAEDHLSATRPQRREERVLTATGETSAPKETPRRASGLPVRWKQVCWVGVGVVAMMLAAMVDYRRLADRAPLLYLLALVLLIGVLLMGPLKAGTKRWFSMGAFQGQPSEVVKPIAALVLARIFAEMRKDELGLREILMPGLTVGILAVLVALEPDLGTAFCLVPLFLANALLAGLRLRVLIIGALVVMLLGGFGWRYIPLKSYQKQRILTFLDPSQDPRGAGYQSIQSQIAVGSGGLLGRGYRRGTQSQLGYLPERHTDFIFSVLAEELGFLGVAVVLSLFLLVLWRCLEAALLARDRLGALFVTGLTAMLGFQVMYNVGMVAGLLPIKGLPLPFMSYGGSSMLSSFLAVGLILNVRMRRFAN